MTVFYQERYLKWLILLLPVFGFLMYVGLSLLYVRITDRHTPQLAQRVNHVKHVVRTSVNKTRHAYAMLTSGRVRAPARTDVPRTFSLSLLPLPQSGDMPALPVQGQPVTLAVLRAHQIQRMILRRRRECWWKRTTLAGKFHPTIDPLLV